MLPPSRISVPAELMFHSQNVRQSNSVTSCKFFFSFFKLCDFTQDSTVSLAEGNNNSYSSVKYLLSCPGGVQLLAFISCIDSNVGFVLTWGLLGWADALDSCFTLSNVSTFLPLHVAYFCMSNYMFRLCLKYPSTIIEVLFRVYSFSGLTILCNSIYFHYCMCRISFPIFSSSTKPFLDNLPPPLPPPRRPLPSHSLG